MTKLIVIALLLGAACSRETPPPTPAEQSTAALPAGLLRVADSSQVCMVNNQFMGVSQIPVVVQGRTYFGCCPDCKAKLETQPALRTAVDPVTGEPVDKATAVIVQDGSGKVFYFASEDTLHRYRG